LSDIVSVIIDGLMPGELYDFRFFSVSESLRSTAYELRLRTQPLISSLINIVIDEQDTRTLGIKYTPTPRRAVTFDRYRFQLTSDPSIPAQEKLANDSHRLVLFDRLVPGRLYNLSIWTVSGGVYATPIQRQLRLYPEPVRNLQAQRLTDDEITLSWSPPFGEQDGYEVTYLDPTRPNQLISNVTAADRISYKQLRPHTNYTFEVCSLAGRLSGLQTLRSSPVARTLQTAESVPGQVTQFRSIRVRPNEITLAWKLPSIAANGVITGFKITYEPLHEPIADQNPEPAEASIDSLLETNSFTSGRVGAANSKSEPSLTPNRRPSVSPQYSLFEPTATEGTIGQLQPGRRYVFSIQAHTKVGAGAPVIVQQQTPIWAPPRPAASSQVQLIARGTTSLRVRFRRNFFSDMHGPVRFYTIIVAEQSPSVAPDSSIDSAIASSVELPSWYDVQSKATWPPYQTTAAYQAFSAGQLLSEYTIGEQECNLESSDLTSGASSHLLSSLSSNQRYCNGPLKPGSVYRIKVRAFTDHHKYSETELSAAMNTEPDHRRLWLSLGMPLLLLLLAASAFAAWRARHRWTGALAGRSLHALTTTRSGKPPLPGGNEAGVTLARHHLLLANAFTKSKLATLRMSPNSPDSMPVEALPPGIGPSALSASTVGLGPNMGGPMPVEPMRPVPANRPVKLIEFGAHFRRMSADSDFRFSEEFELLRHVGRDRPCSAAELSVNRPKNRFTNILPYDHSRVKLLPTDDEEGSDYINANYVPGFNSPREFLVTQGPLPGTRDDFWRMIWEQNSRAVVMLTRCVEKGREKCDRYWPFVAGQATLYGDIAVTLMSEQAASHWTVYELKVSRLEHTRIIRHFHFTSWPDFGVPEPPSTLVRFVRSFRERVPAEGANRPITVHCSAGVGRSGTWIALDRLLQHVRRHDYADVYGFVHEMRRQRVWMVQNEVSFTFAS
jgi:protein tyrosine phosphatase